MDERCGVFRKKKKIDERKEKRQTDKKKKDVGGVVVLAVLSLSIRNEKMKKKKKMFLPEYTLSRYDTLSTLFYPEARVLFFFVFLHPLGRDETHPLAQLVRWCSEKDTMPFLGRYLLLLRHRHPCPLSHDLDLFRNICGQTYISILVGILVSERLW